MPGEQKSKEDNHGSDKDVDKVKLQSTEKLKAVVESAESSAKKVNEIKSELEKKNTDLAALIDESKKTIDGSKTGFAKSLEEINNTKEALNKEIATQKSNIQSILNESTQQKGQIATLQTEATKISGQINELHKASSSANEKTKQLATIAESTQKRINEYEEFLKKAREEYASLNKQVVGLLPGATSAGLATAFHDRKEGYKKSLKLWSWLRGMSIAAFVVYGIVVYTDLKEMIEAFSEKEIWDIFKIGFVYLINKSPIILGLVMFEEFARRRYNRLVRAEEDYAYKQVMSQAFEGYKKQLSGMSGEKDTLVAIFIKKVLDIISENPARFISEEQEKNLREKLVEIVKKQMNVNTPKEDK